MIPNNTNPNQIFGVLGDLESAEVELHSFVELTQGRVCIAEVTYSSTLAYVRTYVFMYGCLLATYQLYH